MATRRIVMHFPPTMIDEPIISNLVHEYDLGFNILRASITPKQEGVMVVILDGTDANLDAALAAASSHGVQIEPLQKQIVRNEEKCTECGACVMTCPTNALWIHLETRHVHFDAEECIACELCVPVCPPRAMEIEF